MEDHIDSEPWEALDIDDSDTPFLRPCKRHNQDLPILSQSSSSPSQSQQPKPSPPSPPLIPGPAGAVQAAMHRRARKDWSFAGDEDPIPTQEYIRKVLENGDVCDDDDDFTSNPWLSALDFVQREGVDFGLFFLGSSNFGLYFSNFRFASSLVLVCLS